MSGMGLSNSLYFIRSDLVNGGEQIRLRGFYKDKLDKHLFNFKYLYPNTMSFNGMSM